MPPFAQFDIHSKRSLWAERQHQPAATVAQIELPAVIVQSGLAVGAVAKLQTGCRLLQPLSQ